MVKEYNEMRRAAGGKTGKKESDEQIYTYIEMPSKLAPLKRTHTV